jgi:hypothetical protein
MRWAQRGAIHPHIAIFPDRAKSLKIFEKTPGIDPEIFPLFLHISSPDFERFHSPLSYHSMKNKSPWWCSGIPNVTALKEAGV